MKHYCDNVSAISIAHNPVQHDHTKHIEVDRHFIKEKLESGLICTPFISTREQIADILTKGLAGADFPRLVGKLGMDNIHSQLENHFQRKKDCVHNCNYLVNIYH